MKEKDMENLLLHFVAVGELDLKIGLGIVQTYEMHEQAWNFFLACTYDVFGSSLGEESIVLWMKMNVIEMVLQWTYSPGLNCH